MPPRGECTPDAGLLLMSAHLAHVQILTASHPARWIGVIGQSGHGPGLFTYPRGLAIARKLLYVCEERQVQVGAAGWAAGRTLGLLAKLRGIRSCLCWRRLIVKWRRSHLARWLLTATDGHR